MVILIFDFFYYICKWKQMLLLDLVTIKLNKHSHV